MSSDWPLPASNRFCCPPQPQPCSPPPQPPSVCACQQLQEIFAGSRTALAGIDILRKVGWEGWGHLAQGGRACLPASFHTCLSCFIWLMHGLLIEPMRSAMHLAAGPGPSTSCHLHSHYAQPADLQPPRPAGESKVGGGRGAPVLVARAVCCAWAVAGQPLYGEASMGRCRRLPCRLATTSHVYLLALCCGSCTPPPVCCRRTMATPSAAARCRFWPRCCATGGSRATSECTPRVIVAWRQVPGGPSWL